MENKQFQQLYFLILPHLVDSFVAVKRSLYACRVYRYLVLSVPSTMFFITRYMKVGIPT